MDRMEEFEQVEAEHLAEGGARRIDRDNFQVVSSKGDKTYNVRFRGRGDGEHVYLWDCDCLAGRHGRMCKHIRAVADAIHRAADEFGYE